MKEEKENKWRNGNVKTKQKKEVSERGREDDNERVRH